MLITLLSSQICSTMDLFLSTSKQKAKMQERKSVVFPPKVLYENRYCNQDDFSILVCGGDDKEYGKVDNILKLHGPTLECSMFTLMKYAHSDCETAVVNSDLFILGGFWHTITYDKTIRKFCNKSKTWSHKKQSYQDNNIFCLSSFKKNYMFLVQPAYVLFTI